MDKKKINPHKKNKFFESTKKKNKKNTKNWGPPIKNVGTPQKQQLCNAKQK